MVSMDMLHPAPNIEMNDEAQAYSAAIARQVNRYTPIALTDMNGVTLLDRTDTKFVMHVTQLSRALAALTDYQVLEIDGTRLNHYQTLYFDTPGFGLYMQHHNGVRPRYKVRSREYVDTHLAYLEVKRKNYERTIKKRLQTPDLVTELQWPVEDFVHTHFPFDVTTLEPKLWNSFQRITLVSMSRPERLTLDINLAFQWEDRHAELPGIAIAEVKREGYSADSAFVRQMRAQGIRSMGFSKYCTGVDLLYEVKNNKFRPRMRQVDKIMQQEQQR